MIAETCFTEREKNALQTMRLKVEMAVANEWVVRDEDSPDSLMLVYLSPTDGDEFELQAACSCTDGAIDRPCPHALAAINEVRSNPHILIQIFRRPRPSAV